MNWKTPAGARRLLEKWTREEPHPEAWPPYPIVANQHGEMARLYIGSDPPEGWTIIGLNCARTAALRRIGTPKALVIHSFAE